MRQDLVVRAVDGDHDAFAELVTESIGRWFEVARLILRDTELAEDAVQEGLVAAWRDIRGLRDADRFDAWLHRLLIRACYREARRTRKVARLEVHVTAIDVPAPGDGDSVADRDQLDWGFRRLKPDQRAILVLHFYADKPLAEVAEILDIPLGTAKSRLHRSIQALRAHLDSEARAARLTEGRFA
jgi:RNA polymerase sigma-70 factor (ECF subfamily)